MLSERPRPRFHLSAPQFLSVGFLVVIIVGSILLSLPWAVKSGEINYLNALFTATSATCVTGLVVVDTAQHWTTFGQVVIMLLIQIGGLGIMSFAVFYALILGKKIQLRQRLMMQQTINKSDPGGVVSLFRRLLIFSFCAEGIAAVILALHWTPSLGFSKALWFGLFHSISAFNNAGFDLWGGFRSLTKFVGDPVVTLTIAGLIIIGGLGFVVVDELFSYRKKRALSVNARVVLYTTLVLIVGGTLILFFSEYNHALSGFSLPTKMMASFFQAVTPRTAGFNTLDVTKLLLSSQMLLAMLMFIGGSPGSTAGGIKTSTLVLILAAIHSQILGRRETEIMQHRVPHEDVLRALSVISMYAFIVFLMTFMLALTHKADLMMIIFEVCSALGTVGLTLGLTLKLTALGKMLIIITMLLGRLGPLTLAFALAYKEKQPDIRYPISRITIG